MANATFKKGIVLLVFTFFFSFISFGQKKSKLKEFSEEFPIYLSQLGDFMTATENDELKSVYKRFLKESENLSNYEKTKIIEISNDMLSKRLRPKPHFSQFISATLSVNNSANGDALLQQWLSVVDETIQVTTIKKLMSFCAITTDLVSNNILRSSKSAEWTVSSDATPNFQFEMIEPVIVFDLPFNLRCSSDVGSYEINQTTGKYYFVSTKWLGQDGVINWESAGYSKDSVFAEVDSYKIDIRRSKIVADSSIFFNKKIFLKPILGQVVNNLVRGKQSDKYPRFTSYNKNIELKEIFPNVDYRGGYKILGKDFIADGGKYAQARIVFKRNGKDLFIANADRFSIGSDKISSKNAGVRIYFDKDSIYHGNIQFKYIDSKRQLQLYRNINGVSGSPMLNTYHNVTMDFELLQWNIDKDIITFGSLPGTTESHVEFESVNRYLQSKYESMQGIDAVHPLFLVNNYIRAKEEERFFVEDFAKFAHYPIEQIQHHLMQLANDGFVYYNFAEGRVVVLSKLYNYINAASEIGDYDVISFSSTVTHGEYQTPDKYLVNAALNIKTKDLNILGIHNIELSKERAVYLYPKNGKLILKKNRDFVFNGQIYAGNGRVNLFGREFFFHYDEFKVDLNQIDSVQLSVPLNKIEEDIYANQRLTPIKTVIEAVKGELRIDDPSNKSGVRKDSFPEFPIFKSFEDSYAYYDRESIYGGVYNRDQFSFHLQPFEIDSLDNYTGKGLWFAGTFESGGIFPSFDDTLRLQNDYSLGFSRSTPVDGFAIYGGKGKFYNEIHLSHKGLKGRGDLTYLTANAASKEIFFFPDSTNLQTENFVINEVITGIEFPDVVNTVTYTHFEPYNDRLEVNKISDEFDFFKGKASFIGDLLMRPTGLTGGGIMKLEKAQVTADLFTYNASWFGSDNSDLDVFAEGGKLAIQALNLKSHIDLKIKEGVFNSNGDNSYVRFPANQYIAYIDKLHWEMNKESFILGDEIASVGNLTKFISTHSNQDSLSFTARTASYNLKDFIINTKGVDQIAVADAIIYPDSGIVAIAKESVIKTLFNARILADNLTEYHTFTNSVVDIISAHKYSASGNYTYKDVLRNEQYIFFKEISVNSDTITIARGDVATDKVFHLDSKFDFKGSVDLVADQRNLTFDGFFRINHNCDLLSKEWVRFNSPVNPKNINIKLDEVLFNDNNERLFAGMIMQEDTSGIYSVFFNKKKNIIDVDVISADYSLSYNKRTSSFIINSKDSLDNIFTLFENTCKTKGEGEINLNLDLGKVGVTTLGIINNNIMNNKTDLEGFILLDFFFSDQAMMAMTKDINGPNKDGIGYDEYNELYVSNIKRLVSDQAKAAQFILDLEVNKINSLPSELITTLAITDISMIWDGKNKAFVNKGDFGLGNILSNPINDIMTGFVVLEKKYGNSGDGMSIYIKTFDGESYWFKYQSNAMWAFSYNSDFKTAINSLGESKRRLEGSKYNFSLRTESVFKKQLRQLEKKY